MATAGTMSLCRGRAAARGRVTIRPRRVKRRWRGAGGGAVTVDDSTTPVEATLSVDGAGDEDSGSITYTVSVQDGEQPQGAQDFTVTLSNLQVITVTIAEGELSGSTTVVWGSVPGEGEVALTEPFPNSDVYDEAAYDLSVSSVVVDGNGGEE